MAYDKYNDPKALRDWAGRIISSILKGIDELPLETMKKIMEKSGETCAKVDSLEITEKIAEETDDLKDLVVKLNEQVPWCGKWKLKGNKISSVCHECGCPLIRNKIFELSRTFCYCSLGWVKITFETLLKKPIEVELEKSIGSGDKICKFNVYI